ncbi:MAG: hypothetical protein KDB23_14430 [Planctomycetales bacterium]|nr:hypothetical protein [Planctomycetales bacterium]
MKRLVILLAAVALTASASAVHAGSPYAAIRRAHADRGAQWYNTNRSWHGQYANVQWGHPVALIVPPTANMQTEYAWGVGRTTMTPIHHQFGRPIATPGAGGAGLLPTPLWPSSTAQIGYYSVRGPW